jgi:hypothetical protein
MQQELQQCNTGIVKLLAGWERKKEMTYLTSAERGNLITLVTCMNATGTYVPPLIVFPRKNMKEELMVRAPAGSISA